jgi:hypothetical protein
MLNVFMLNVLALNNLKLKTKISTKSNTNFAKASVDHSAFVFDGVSSDGRPLESRRW